jgi:hypothetical protein
MHEKESSSSSNRHVRMGVGEFQLQPVIVIDQNEKEKGG